eukprot:123608_1
MHHLRSLLLSSFFFVWIWTCIASVSDEHDCKYWMCDHHKSNVDLHAYTNCSSNNAFWQENDPFVCTYCQRTSDGVCWCGSKSDCEVQNHLVFGVSLMALSALFAAIIWYKYIEKHRRIVMARKLLTQQEERGKNKYETAPNACMYGSDMNGGDNIETVRSAIEESVITIQNERDIHRFVGRYTNLCFCVWTATVLSIIAFCCGLVVVIYGLTL